MFVPPVKDDPRNRVPAQVRLLICCSGCTQPILMATKQIHLPGGVSLTGLSNVISEETTERVKELADFRRLRVHGLIYCYREEAVLIELYPVSFDRQAHGEEEIGLVAGVLKSEGWNIGSWLPENKKKPIGLTGWNEHRKKCKENSSYELGSSLAEMLFGGMLKK